MATTHQVITAEQLLAMGDIGRCELIEGELIMMSPAGFEHGVLITRISSPMHIFVDDHDRGIVTGAETGFLISRDPDTVRAPDVGFVRRERIPAERFRGFFPGPPDLAVEVVSPDDRPKEVLDKVHAWLCAGCQAVWVVDPEPQTITVYTATSVVVLHVGDEVTGGEVLPAFVLKVADVFRPLR